MFRDMIAAVKADSIALLLRVQPAAQSQQPVSVFARTPQHEVHEEVSTRLADRFAQTPPAPSMDATPMSPSDELPPPKASKPEPVHHAGPKIGRNEPCHCGSGLKFKKCHGK